MLYARLRPVESHLRSCRYHCLRRPCCYCSCLAQEWEPPTDSPRFPRPDGSLAESSGYRQMQKTTSYDPYRSVGAITRKGDGSVVPAGRRRCRGREDNRYLISADIARHDVIVGLPGLACEFLRVGVEQRKNGWTVHGCEGRLSKKAPFSEVPSRPYLFGANTRPLDPHPQSHNCHTTTDSSACFNIANFANKQNKQRYPYYAKTGRGTINRHTSLSCQCRDDMLLYVRGYVTVPAQRMPCQMAVYSKSGK